jgi:hypothetical protein
MLDPYEQAFAALPTTSVRNDDRILPTFILDLSIHRQRHDY